MIDQLEHSEECTRFIKLFEDLGFKILKTEDDGPIKTVIMVNESGEGIRILLPDRETFSLGFRPDAESLSNEEVEELCPQFREVK